MEIGFLVCGKRSWSVIIIKAALHWKCPNQNNNRETMMSHFQVTIKCFNAEKLYNGMR